MTTDVAVPVKFEDRVKDLLRDNFGKLLTDEELQKIMTRGMEELLFTPRPDPNRTYHNAPPLPPLAVQIMMEEFKPMMQQAVRDWCAANEELVAKTMNDVLGNNAVELVTKVMNSLVSVPFETMRMNLNQALMNSQGRSAY